MTTALLATGLGAGLSGAAALADASGSVATAATAAATTPGCDHADAGTGRFARGICWLDLSGYRPAQASSNAGQPMSLALPDGSTLAFTLKVTGGAVRATALPTSPAAFLGNNLRYTGVAGSPALYQRASGASTTATLSGITVTDATGDPVSRFALASADAESTDAGESITWSADQPLTSLTQTATTKGLGNSCNGGLTGVGTTSVTCSAINSSDSKTGAPILAADHPTTVSAQLSGGQEAVAFGVLVSRVQLATTVVNAFAGDDFRVDVTDPDGTNVGTGSTGGTSTASTPRTTVLTSIAAESFTFTQTATAGALASYRDDWSCTRNGLTDPTLPDGDAGASAVVSVDIGDLVSCAITDTALPAALSLTTQAATPVDVDADGLTDAGDTIAYAFTVTNSGSLPINNLAVRDVQAGSVTCLVTAVAPGASTTCAADHPYVVTAADVVAGTAHNRATVSGNPTGESATVTSSESVADTPTTAPAPALSLVKTATIRDVDGDFQIDLGDTITWSFRVTNSGNVPVSAVAISDPLAGAVTCPVTTLAPGAQTTCGVAAAYVITQSDVDAGVVSSSATATATDPDGGAVTSPPASVSTPVAHRAALAATERAVVTDVNGDGHVGLGDTIAYSTVVHNVGTVTLHGVSVTDPLAGAVTCPAGPIAPGDLVTCVATAPYSIIAADVVAGQVANTAVAHALDPSGVAVDSASVTARTPIG